MIKTLPNILTFLRIIIIPFIVWALFVGSSFSHMVAAILFFVAGITDYFDGKLARAWKVESSFGKLFDPIADKLLVVTTILMLVNADLANIFASLIIICREIAISGLREFLAQINVSVPVSKLAKIKTGFQMLAIFLLIIGVEGAGGEIVNDFGTYCLWIAAFLTIVTGYAYLKAGIKHLESTI